MSNEIKETVDGLKSAWNEFKQTNDARLKEIESKGAADPLTKEKLSKIDTFLDEQKKLTDDFAEMKKRNEALETAFNRQPGADDQKDSKSETKEVKEFVAAFKDYVRKGNTDGLAQLQAKAMSVSSDPDGGYTVTPQMSAQIITKVYETSPIRPLATVETIGTDALDILVDTDTAVAGWTGEQSVRTGNTTTPQIGKKQIVAHEMYAIPKATQKLLDDSGIDIEAWLSGKVTDIFSRTENLAFVLGTGVAQPRGFMTYNNGTTSGTVEQIGSGTSGVFTTDGLIALQTALKEPYQNGASFLTTRTSVGLIRKLKDATGRYIWEPSFQTSKPDTLLGKPIIMAADIAEASAASLSAAYGNFKQGYTIVDRMGVRILRDPFSSKPYVQFYTTKRTGGDVTNFEAIKIQILS